MNAERAALDSLFSLFPLEGQRLSKSLTNFLQCSSLQMFLTIIYIVYILKSPDVIQDLFSLGSVKIVQTSQNFEFLVSCCHSVVVDDNTITRKDSFR